MSLTNFKFNDEVKLHSLKRFDELRKELEIQSAESFNDKNVKAEAAIDIIVNLIFLLNRGQKFTEQEKESLFFSTTKLLHNVNPLLRRLIFLFVKELNWWQSSFILTGSLISELNNQGDNLVKPNCFRLLGQIIDLSSINVVERILKPAISNKEIELASSALVCSIFMNMKGFGIAKNWVNEITEKLYSSLEEENLHTFLCIILLRQIKANDRVFLIKIFNKIAENSGTKSKFAICQLIRYISAMMNKPDLDQASFTSFHNYLERTIYNIDESIRIESCRAVLGCPKTKQNLKKATIGILCDLISSGNKIVRFAALKTLDKYIEKFGESMAIDIFLEIEKIIEDNNTNSSIKAYAFSIFLKISKGLSDFRLEKMLKTFVEQFGKFKEDFKKEIVVISKNISRENPSKNKLYFNFFSTLFKQDSGPQTKLEILDAIIWFIYNDKDLKLQALFFLAEYIFDCQYDVVKVRILNLLGKECSLLNNPGKLVRYIYNQIILEGPMVRASAISSLCEIGIKVKNLREIILKLIEKCLKDNDNEVRERAYLHMKCLKELISEEEKNSEGNNEESANEADKNMKEVLCFVYCKNEDIQKKNKSQLNEINIDLLQAILKSEKDSLLQSGKINEKIISILNDTDKISQIILKKEEEENKNVKKDKSKKGKEETKESGQESEYKKTTFYKIYGIPKLFTPFKPITDNSAEYFTRYRKIIHEKVVVLDFEITNTIELQTINNVSMEVEELSSNGFDFSKAEIIQINSLKTNETGHLYFKILKEESEHYNSCTFQICLKFDLQELDVKGNPHGMAVKESYKIDNNIEISYSDYYMKNNKITSENFQEFWKQAESSDFKSAKEKMALPYHSVKEAVKNFNNIIGFDPINNLENLDSSVKKYECDYAYKNIEGDLLLIKFQVIINEQNKCLSHILILSQDETVPELIVNKIYA